MTHSLRALALSSLVCLSVAVSVLVPSPGHAAPARASRPEGAAEIQAPKDGASLKDPVSARAVWEAKEALRLQGSPRAAAHLYRLHALRDDLDSLALLSDTYASILRAPRAHALTRNTARLLAAEVERAKGKLEASDALLEPMGFIRHFYVVGGFDNEGKNGCDTEYGPEKASAHLGEEYAAKARNVRWRKLELDPPDRYVDLSTAVRPQKEVVAYAMTYLDAPADTRTEIGVGTSGGFRLFVNGALAAKSDTYNLPRPDQARLAVNLRKGMNRIVLKVCQSAGPLGFFLRQSPPAGAAQARAVLPRALPPLAKGQNLGVKALPTLASSMEALVQSAPRDAVLRGAYATVLAQTRAYDDHERTAGAQARAAAELAPKDAELQLLASQLEHEDTNVRRHFLQRALTAEPRHPRARLELAQLELSHDHPDRALALAEALLADYPDYSLAYVLKARAHEDLGEWPRAANALEEAYARFPNRPREIRDGARIARRLDRFDAAIERLERALAARFDDGHSRRTLANLLTDVTRVADAEKAWNTHLTLDPYDNNARLQLAQLLVQNGREEEAFRLYREASALSPDEPEIDESLGRALLQTGKRKEALLAFERSLALRPQNPGLKETVRALQKDAGDEAAHYAIDVKPLLRATEARHAKEDAVYLVDNTHVRVQSSGLTSRFQQFAVKVQTDRGVEAFRSYAIAHAPSRQEVRILRTRIVKPDGSLIESYGESDRAVNEPWSGMYYDTRVKQLSFPSLEKGDVLEVWYRLEDTARDNLLSDYWGDVESIQSTYPKLRYQYLVDMPKERPLFWNRTNLPKNLRTAEESPAPGRTLYRFASNDVDKLVPEPSMPGWSEVAQTLHVSTYKAWEDVGRYYWGLIRDQLTPNDELRRTVDKALVGVDRKDSLAVVRALYNFVVTNTRYVALEFGIHGYKPYRVDTVLARRFGDCKDKASLIHAMLKVAGVESRLVLLRMRHLGDIGGEPASLSAFNHAILYVPQYDLYLDGTAEFHGAKELPTADRAANVLIVEPDGKSSFRKIPEAKAEDNATSLAMEVSLRTDGSARLLGKSVVTGIQAPDYRRAYQAQATRKATFERGWAQSYPGLKVERISLSDLTKLDEDVQLEFQMAAPRFSEVLPGRLRFYPFGAGSSYVQRYAPLAERRFDVVLSAPSVSRFSYRYALPAGTTPEELPPTVDETGPFGRLRMSHRLEGNTLVSEGEVSFDVARIRAKDYAAYRAFLGRIDAAFSRKVLLRVGNGQESAQSQPE